MSASSPENTRWLLEALAAARPWRGRVAPNPAVGAALVRDGKLLATGAHEGPGTAHAEPSALSCVSDASGATLYVTLEPCNHHGRTPPCTDRILSSGVSRVVYAHPDKNPRVLGGGAQRLREAGIAIEQVSVGAIETFYRSFDRASLEAVPTVTAKLAVDANGRYAQAGSGRYRITGEAANAKTQALRAAHDAILTTAATVNADDPRLDVRGNHPRPVPIFVWDQQATLRLDRALWETAQSITVFYGANAPPGRLQTLERAGAQLVALQAAQPFESAMTQVASAGVHDLWVEAGGRFLRALAETSYLNRLVLYLGRRQPLAAAGPEFALPEGLPKAITKRLSAHRQEALGDDTAYLYWAPGEDPL